MGAQEPIQLATVIQHRKSFSQTQCSLDIAINLRMLEAQLLKLSRLLRTHLVGKVSFAGVLCIERMYMITCQRCSAGISSAYDGIDKTPSRIAP